MTTIRQSYQRLLQLVGAAFLFTAVVVCPNAASSAEVLRLDDAVGHLNSTYPVSGLINVAEGVYVEYRDWGGEGTPIILLSGLGNTAAVFDELAPRLTPFHRVLGLTRRGYGASSTPGEGYDVATRVADALAAIDALGVRRALLVGHSIAGDELTGIAQARPDLLAGLVYLDAALDRSDPALAVFGECLPLSPSPEGLIPFLPGEVQNVDGELQPVTFAAAAKVVSGILGASYPVSELHRVFALNPNGTLGTVQHSIAEPALSAGSEAVGPDYRGIRVPVTALYADDSQPEVAFPIAALAGSEVRASLQDCATRIAKAKRTLGADKLRAAVPDARIEIVPNGAHYFFLQQPDRVAKEILLTAARANW